MRKTRLYLTAMFILLHWARLFRVWDNASTRPKSSTSAGETGPTDLGSPNLFPLGILVEGSADWGVELAPRASDCSELTLVLF